MPPPNELNEIKNDNVISLLKTIKTRYNNPAIICYGGLNIPTNSFKSRYEDNLPWDFNYIYDKGEFFITRGRYYRTIKMESNYINYFINKKYNY